MDRTDAGVKNREESWKSLLPGSGHCCNCRCAREKRDWVWWGKSELCLDLSI